MMRDRRAILGCVLCLFAAAGCVATSNNATAANSGGTPAAVTRGWAKGAPLATVVVPYIGDGLEMAIVPTPKQVVYADKVFAAGNIQIVLPDEYEHPGTLRDLKKMFPGVAPVKATAWQDDAAGLAVVLGGPERNVVAKQLLAELGVGKPANSEQMGREGYTLVVTQRANGRVAAILAGNSPAGDFWALQTLKQLLVAADGKRYIAGVWMVDWPSFPSRGSKGGRNYQPQYKDNFIWGGGSPAFYENFGHNVPYMAPGGKLDCSEAALAKYDVEIKKHFKTGARAFAFKFDDVIVGMTDETAKRFDNNYGAAICFFVKEMDRRAKQLDPSCKLYYLPQCYYSNSFYPEFAKAIRDAGGLPEDTGLCWTGTGVFSRTIPLEDTIAYMEAFGCTKTKGMIYDNFMRKGDNFPIRGRGPELLPHLDGIFSENSTYFNRITRCDFNWNPEAYNSERSLKLACRETVRRNPKAYRALYALVNYYDKNHELDLHSSRDGKIAATQKVNVELKKLLAEAMAVEELQRNGIVSGLSRAIGVRLKKEAKMRAAGYRQVGVVRIEAAPKIDGKLHEAVWQRAAVISDFVNWDQARWQKLGENMGAPVRADQRTTIRLAYDENNLYIGALCKSDKPVNETNCCSLSHRAIKNYGGVKLWWPNVDPATRDVYGVWHSPALELFVAPHQDRMNYYHMIGGVTGLTYDKYSGQPEPMWDPDWKVAGATSKDGTEFSIEIAIPFASFGLEGVKPGDTWGMNFCRVWPGHQMWSFVWSPRGFHTPEDFGTLTFK